MILRQCNIPLVNTDLDHSQLRMLILHWVRGMPWRMVMVDIDLDHPQSVVIVIEEPRG